MRCLLNTYVALSRAISTLKVSAIFFYVTFCREKVKQNQMSLFSQNALSDGLYAIQRCASSLSLQRSSGGSVKPRPRHPLYTLPLPPRGTPLHLPTPPKRRGAMSTTSRRCLRCDFEDTNIGSSQFIFSGHRSRTLDVQCSNCIRLWMIHLSQPAVKSIQSYVIKLL